MFTRNYLQFFQIPSSRSLEICAEKLLDAKSNLIKHLIENPLKQIYLSTIIKMAVPRSFQDEYQTKSILYNLIMCL